MSVPSISILPMLQRRFQLIRELGEGTYGLVWLANDLFASRQVALKVITKKSIKKMSQINRLRREINIHKLLEHPNIIQVYEVLETDEEIIMIMEFALNGDLFDYILENKRLQENEARRIFLQLASALRYCHTNSIVHRDLKPENLLLDKDNNLKMTDFGFVKGCRNDASNEKLQTYCGSLYYCPPEMIDGIPYIGPTVDLWSLGVILYVLTNGYMPFKNPNVAELYKLIRTAEFEDGEYSSKACNDLIRCLIRVNPNDRISVEQVLKHPWLNEDKEHSSAQSDMELRDSKSVERSRIISQLYSIESESKSLELHIKEHGLKDLSLVLPIYSSDSSGNSTAEFMSNNSQKEKDLVIASSNSSEFSSNRTMKEFESSGYSSQTQKQSKLQKLWNKMTHQTEPIIAEENNFTIYKNKMTQFHTRAAIFK